MRQVVKKVRLGLNSRLGFFILAVLLFSVKSYIAYRTKFNLGVKGSMQELLLALNPLPFAILLFGLALYMRGRKSYWFMIGIDAILSTWLFSNILYYREFSDFLTFNLMKGSSSVSTNLSKSIAGILKPTDFLVFLDVALLIIFVAFKWIKMDTNPFKLRYAATISALAVVLFGANLSLAESDRSGLLTRTFDNNYIVKYLGLEAYTVYDGVKTTKNNTTKANANSSDLASVQNYLKKNRISPNIQYSGVAKGKNVFVIHLESLQQFMIDYKVNGQEIMPNIDKLYHENDTLSFDNFYNQVGQGKTADAELMLENSLFGLPEGAAMITDGTTNTFQAAPAILDQKGYTTASFHGDVPSFWNRDNAYKSWGYDYFFSKDYYKNADKAKYNVGYGMKDKIFLRDSAQYIQQLPQPFYAKLITVTNHYPYILDSKNKSIDAFDTGDSTVDPYAQTAHYLDQSVGEFMSYLKKTGLDKNSMIVMYGDHYGISNNHKPAIAKLLGKKKVTNYDLANFQKVPFMIHMPGLKGGINHTYGGEIDVLPTILNLLGVKNQDTIQFGQDLLAPNRNQTVAFRNGDFVSPTYTKYGGDVYDSQTGKELKHLSAKQKVAVDNLQNHVTTELSASDKVVNGDLLRFYQPKGFKKVIKSDFNYKESVGVKKLKKAEKDDPTSVKAKNNGKSTMSDYQTDAPELKSSK
ncbi:LTA synthase family protein [Loigolactobacillus backii]|uniref:Glycerol phosphate lipoteichoic acid synthase n=1 Tax=Loigolactobacillus backii TaxID=375175 RepID=A0A192H5D7_9LACO|nr:LTA synthase family protein [Loigolactobacillus backii]ANK60080.1 glycerol phosphate lipoteichoic acid synthase [Loigolactobacillus backii]ANK63427.1 glycerol phosphate lipoteichoic acid synthase [Loigolactobacillus backii]ANK64962.1 glycerol phosphate lipoteichoic acid synthase [Loigolactobacillus backii]ANK69568.1 glycerol phosphate lipoteichoic acid synthase [Loigolactobacillus backii]MDA5388880.1 LTA synthase family protein [Loigolactobacillus backii]